MAQKFRLYGRRIELKPENTDKIVLTTCILHNFIKHNDVHATASNLKNIPGQGGNSQFIAFDVRDKLAVLF